MARRPTMSSLTKKLDDEWSFIIRARNGHLCEKCRRPANQVHHFYSRRFRRVRWDERNLVSSCPGCHLYAHDCSAAYAEWFKAQRPEDYAYLLNPESRAPIHRSITQLQDMLEEARRLRREVEYESLAA